MNKTKTDSGPLSNERHFTLQYQLSRFGGWIFRRSSRCDSFLLEVFLPQFWHVSNTTLLDTGSGLFCNFGIFTGRLAKCGLVEKTISRAKERSVKSFATFWLKPEFPLKETINVQEKNTSSWSSSDNYAILNKKLLLIKVFVQHIGKVWKLNLEFWFCEHISALSSTCFFLCLESERSSGKDCYHLSIRQLVRGNH